jgi:hypothetical protein
VHFDRLRNEVKRCSRIAASTLLVVCCGCAQDLTSATAATAYAPAIDQPVLQTSASEYGPGDVITIRLANMSSRPLGYNLCRSKLERDADGGWVVVHDMLAEFCTAELRTLAPGRAVAYSFKPRQRVRGPLRIRTELQDHYGRVRVDAVSNVFTMRSD